MQQHALLIGLLLLSASHVLAQPAPGPAAGARSQAAQAAPAPGALAAAGATAAADASPSSLELTDVQALNEADRSPWGTISLPTALLPALLGRAAEAGAAPSKPGAAPAPRVAGSTVALLEVGGAYYRMRAELPAAPPTKPGSAPTPATQPKLLLSPITEEEASSLMSDTSVGPSLFPASGGSGPDAASALPGSADGTQGGGAAPLMQPGAQAVNGNGRTPGERGASVTVTAVTADGVLQPAVVVLEQEPGQANSSTPAGAAAGTAAAGAAPAGAARPTIAAPAAATPPAAAQPVQAPVVGAAAPPSTPGLQPPRSSVVVARRGPPPPGTAAAALTPTTTPAAPAAPAVALAPVKATPAPKLNVTLPRAATVPAAAVPGGKVAAGPGKAAGAVPPTSADLATSQEDEALKEEEERERSEAQKPQPAPAPDVINILHLNDWHNRMEPTSESYCALCDHSGADLGRCSGGLARMVRFADAQRAKLGWNSTLLLNAGDDFIGTVWDRKYKTNQAAYFMGLLRLDASTVGNHEFDWGTDELGKYVEALSHPMLGACNLEIPGDHRLSGRLRNYITRMMGNVKVCVFGLTTTETNPKMAWPLKIKDPYYNGKQCVQNMRKDGCDVIILLSHLGYTADIVAGQLIPGLDLVVGGHSHSLLWSGSSPAWDKTKGSRDNVWGSYPTWVDSKVEKGRRVPVVQAGWGSRYMGLVRLWLRTPAEWAACGGKGNTSTGGGGCGPIKSVEGWPTLLGGPKSENPTDEDPNVVAEIKKWRYW